MPITGDEYGTTITGNAINWYQCKVLVTSIRMYLRSGMMLSRSATPANMRALATLYTGKTYTRSRKGLEMAMIDIQALLDNHTPDEMSPLVGATA